MHAYASLPNSFGGMYLLYSTFVIPESQPKGVVTAEAQFRIVFDKFLVCHKCFAFTVASTTMSVSAIKANA